MNPIARATKQFTIAIIFFTLLGIVVFFLGSLLPDPAASPTPDPRDQLKPIDIIFSNLFPVGTNDYDFLVKVRNPNGRFGSPTVRYELIFLNSTNGIVATKQGSFYILPGETKYIVESPLKFQEAVSSVSMKISSIDWRELDFVTSEGIDLVTTNVVYQTVPQAGVFGRVIGSVVNRSDFDLTKVDVAVVLLDSADMPIAVNRTEIRAFLGQATRGYEVNWFAPFSGTVARVDAEAHTDVFQNNNFMRTYGGSEEYFQQF